MFEEYLRSLGLDAKNLDDETKAVMRKAFDLQQEAAKNKDNGKSEERARGIINLANTATATADDHVARGVLSFANELVADKEVSVEDAAGKIREKAIELAKENTGIEPDSTPRQIVVRGGGENTVMSKREIQDAMNYQADDQVVRKDIARSVISHIDGGDPIDLREFKEIEGKSKILAVVGSAESGQVRSVTASAVTAVYQDVGTIMLQRKYNPEEDITNMLVTKIPSTMNENNFPNVEAENGVRRVKEGEPYPIISGSTEDVKIGHTKYGAAISQTLESAVFDNLGYTQVLLDSVSRQINSHRASLRLHRVVSSHSYDGKYINYPGSSDGTSDLYSSTEDDRGNKNLVVSNALEAAADITNVRKVLRAMKDKAGTYIRPQLKTILVPDELFETAWELVNSIYKPTASVENPQQLIPNVYGVNGPKSYVKPEVISDPELDDISDTSWFAGEFQSQFYEKVVWEPRVMPVVASADLLIRDIVNLWIASCCTEVCAVSKKFVVKSISTAS